MHPEIEKKLATLASTRPTRVLDAVVNALDKEEETREVGLIMQGLDLLKKAEQEASTIQPDLAEEVDANGNVLQPKRFSKKQFDRNTSVQNKIKAITTALDQAIASTPNYTTLEQLVSKNKGS